MRDQIFSIKDKTPIENYIGSEWRCSYLQNKTQQILSVGTQKFNVAKFLPFRTCEVVWTLKISTNKVDPDKFWLKQEALLSHLPVLLEFC